jgi:hypothetical protein
MALSMDEQRVLAEIERRLAAEEPALAACLTAFRRPTPGPAAVLRSPRARILGSLFTVLLVATISLMVYAMIPFRAHGARVPPGRSASVPSHTALTASSGGSPDSVRISASPSIKTHPAATSGAQAATSSAQTGTSGAQAGTSGAQAGTSGAETRGKYSPPSVKAQAEKGKSTGSAAVP